jgi:hypothetical protein
MLSLSTNDLPVSLIRDLEKFQLSDSIEIQRVIDSRGICKIYCVN